VACSWNLYAFRLTGLGADAPQPQACQERMRSILLSMTVGLLRSVQPDKKIKEAYQSHSPRRRIPHAVLWYQARQLREACSRRQRVRDCTASPVRRKGIQFQETGHRSTRGAGKQWFIDTVIESTACAFTLPNRAYNNLNIPKCEVNDSITNTLWSLSS